MYLDQSLNKNASKVFTASAILASLSFTLMVKSNLISHLIKPIPWKGPDDLNELIRFENGMKLGVIVPSKTSEIIKAHPSYKSNPSGFKFVSKYLPDPDDMKSFTEGKLAILEDRVHVMTWDRFVRRFFS